MKTKIAGCKIIFQIRSYFVNNKARSRGPLLLSSLLLAVTVWHNIFALLHKDGMVQ
jgi:hypothetical protein